MGADIYLSLPMQSKLDCSKELEATEKYLFRQWERLVNTPDDEYVPQKCGLCSEYAGCTIMLAGECPAYTDEEVKKIMQQGSPEDKVRLARVLKVKVNSLTNDLKKYFTR